MSGAGAISVGGMPVEDSDSSVNSNVITSKWETGLFEIGRCDICMASYFCTPCSSALSRTFLDDSLCCFNMMYLPLCCNTSSRWMIRTAYDIEGDGMSDFLSSCFLPCCTVNQMLQTTYARRNTVINGGQYSNVRDFYFSYGSCTQSVDDIEGCELCYFSTICFPCAGADAVHNSTGMPWCMAFCCTTPCAARNIVRYQYRLKGDEFVEECCLPTLGMVALYGLLATPFVLIPVGSFMTPQIYAESHFRGRSAVDKYLSVAGHHRYTEFTRPNVLTTQPTEIQNLIAVAGNASPESANFDAFSSSVRRDYVSEDNTTLSGDDSRSASISTHDYTQSVNTANTPGSDNQRSIGEGSLDKHSRSQDGENVVPTTKRKKSRRLKPKHLPVAHASIADRRHESLTQATTSFSVNQYNSIPPPPPVE